MEVGLALLAERVAALLGLICAEVESDHLIQRGTAQIFIRDKSLSIKQVLAIADDLRWGTIDEPPGLDLPRKNLNPQGIAWWRGRKK